MSWRNAIWKIAPEKASKIGHTAPFPVELARRLIIFYTYPGETVYDPFSGSGTTGVAALREGRNYVGSEIVKNFYELSLERCSAALDGTGN